MSNYSDKPNNCRVDFFKEGGKWYTTEAIMFDNDLYDRDPKVALCSALKRQIGNRLNDMDAVCLDPYVEHSFPVKVRDWDNFLRRSFSSSEYDRLVTKPTAIEPDNEE